jgi:hypothetical protein
MDHVLKAKYSPGSLVSSGTMAFNRGRRAVGEVVSTLVVLVGAVMMAAVVLSWGLSLLGTTETSYSSALFQSNAQASEQVSIDDVRFVTGPPKSLQIYVRNFGDQPLSVVQVYIDAAAYTTTETTVVARTYGTIAVAYPDWSSGQTYVVRVATERGNIYERSFTAP